MNLRPNIDPRWVARLHDFRPAWWLPGGHAQTLSAAFWKGHQSVEQGVLRSITLPDGDALVALDDCPPHWCPGDPAILMMHGLGGSARNPLLVRIAGHLIQRGVRVFRLNLRGCGAGVGLARLPYNAGSSGDLKAAVQAVIAWCRKPLVEPTPASVPPGPDLDKAQAPTPLTLFGMSLSGNLLLKYLGEEGDHIPPSVQRAIAINPPIDLARSVATLERTLNKGYDRHFVRTLTQQIEAQIRLRPDFAALPHPLPRTLYDFDDRFTAPHGGYPGAAAYYTHSSAITRLPAIRLPTLILTAADDPLVPVEMFHEQRATWPSHIHLAITSGGGHLGYVGSGHHDPDSRWLDWRVCEFAAIAPSTTSC